MKGCLPYADQALNCSFGQLNPLLFDRGRKLTFKNISGFIIPVVF